MNAFNNTTHNVSSENCWEPDSDQLQEKAEDIAFTSLCVLGIFSNIFIIVLAAKYTVRKNLHHLIINMAVSDALFLACNLLRFFKYDIESLYPGGVWGDMICITIEFLTETSYSVSLLTLLVISIERFKATRRTLQRPRPYTVKQRAAVLGICWFIPMIRAVYRCYMTSFDEASKQCLISITLNSLLPIIGSISMIAAISANIIILTLSIITIRRLSNHQAIHDHMSEEQRNTRKKRIRLSVMMVIASALLYACCWWPLLVRLGLLDLESHFPQAIYITECFRVSVHFILTYFLPAVNSCFSPFIYIIFLSDFKEAAKRVLCCCKTTTNQRDAREEIQLDHIQQR